MKTMRSIDGKRIFRVTDEKAATLYEEGSANYATKEEWKKEVRDIDEIHDEVEDGKLISKKKSNKPSKSQKRQMRKTL